MKLLMVLSLFMSMTAIQASTFRSHDLQRSLNADQAKDLGRDVMLLISDLRECDAEDVRGVYMTQAIDTLKYADDRLGYSLTMTGHGKKPLPSTLEFTSKLTITRTRVKETGPKKADGGTVYETKCTYKETPVK